mmetsp:Transcript_62311/g.71553  ORF Transcript_62311/g.71553 Transcript_62311/m.71553 type:complete len:246 (-) Transcript_62311:213-950(-)
MCLIVVAVVVLKLLLLSDFDKERTDAESDKAWRCSVNAKLYITIIRNLEKNSDEYNDNSSKLSSLSSSSLVFNPVAADVDLDGKLSGGMTTGSWNTKYFSFRAANGEEAAPLLLLLQLCCWEAINLLCVVYDADDDDTSGDDDAVTSGDTSDTLFIVSFVLVIVVSSSVSLPIIIVLLLFIKLILNGGTVLLLVVSALSLLLSSSLQLSLLSRFSKRSLCCCCSWMAAKGFKIFNTDVNDFTAAS